MTYITQSSQLMKKKRKKDPKKSQNSKGATMGNGNSTFVKDKGQKKKVTISSSSNSCSPNKHDFRFSVIQKNDDSLSRQIPSKKKTKPKSRDIG